MKNKCYRGLTAILLMSCLLFTSLPAAAGQGVTTFSMKYEGGSLPLDQHNKLKVKLLDQNTIEMTQGKQSFKVPASAVTELSYGNDVHRRVGAAVGVAMVTSGIGALMLLVKTKKHYVGMTWAEPGTDKKGGVVFKVGKGDYRGFLAALEGLTGKKAVNADVGQK